MPETNIPGVPAGGAAFLPPLALSGPVTPYVVSTAGLVAYPATTSCQALLCPSEQFPVAPCLANSDYAKLAPIVVPAGETVVLAIGGCLPLTSAPGQTVSDTQCGPGYEAGLATGNLSATVGQLDSTLPSGGLALHLAQLSPSSQAASVTYVDPTIDASVSLVPEALSGSPAAAVTVPLSEAGVLSAYFVIASPSGPPITQSFAAIQFFQAPATNPTTYFNAPSAYFAAVVGDATDAAAPASLPDGGPNPQFNGYGLHVIAYPERGN
jgi:hypothetical protein